MAFVNPCSKLERAVAAFLVLQGKADADATFISNDLRDRTFPNKTVVASVFNPNLPHRQEGVVYFSIEHRFSVVQDPDRPDTGDLRAEIDAFVGGTGDTMTISDGNSLDAVADGITAAGRWLANTDGTAAGDAVASQNADMLNFRCDWVKMEMPFLNRGKSDKTGDFWSEIMNFSAFVSQAAN